MAVVTRFLEAANQHDADTLYATVHPEFESFQPLHPVRNFRGPGQLISNWKAIFEAEPGFRLTVLRASTTGNTVWVEVHGAGDTAEAAGIFIVGVENSRIRWVRVYSDLVEPAPEKPVDDSPPVAAVAAPEPEEPVTTGPAEGEAEDKAVPSEGETPEPRHDPEPATATGYEGLWAASDDDRGSPTPAAPPPEASPWLVEPVAGSPEGPDDDESPAPPEPGLRLVAPAPLTEPGAGLGSTIDETTVETLVGSHATPDAEPEPALADDESASDPAAPQPGSSPSEPEPQVDDPAPEPSPSEPSPSDDPGGPPWSRLRKALGKD